MSERVYTVTVDVTVDNELTDEFNQLALRRMVDDNTVDRLCYHPGVTCVSVQAKRSPEHEIE